MDKKEITEVIKEHLADFLECGVDIFQQKGLVFHVVGSRAEAYQKPFFQVISMENAIIVAVSSSVLKEAERLLTGKSREEIFECPLLYGQSVYFIPDVKQSRRKEMLPEYTYRMLEGEGLLELQGIKGFDNSLMFDADGNTGTYIVFYAERDGEIAGLAGASIESERVWEIGVDVKEKYRKGGLASVLVNHLMYSILDRNIVPIYCAASSNPASQAAAFRAGFQPCWVSTYKNILDGSSGYDELVRRLYSE